MSRAQEREKNSVVSAIHKRVREVVGLYFVASDNVLGSTWFPFVDTIGLQPAARRGRTPDGAVTIATDLEALVIKAFVGKIERVDVGGGRTVDCVLFRNLPRTDGSSLTAAYEIERRTMISGKQAQRWRRLRILPPRTSTRATRGATTPPTPTPPFVPGEWGGENGLALDNMPQFLAVDNTPSMDPRSRHVNNAFTGQSSDSSAYRRLVRSRGGDNGPFMQLLRLKEEKDARNKEWEAALRRYKAKEWKRKERARKAELGETVLISELVRDLTGSGLEDMAERIDEYRETFAKTISQEDGFFLSLSDERDLLFAMLHRNLVLSGKVDPDVGMSSSSSSSSSSASFVSTGGQKRRKVVPSHDNHYLHPRVADEFREWGHIRLHDKKAPLDPDELERRRFDLTNFIQLRANLGRRTMASVIFHTNELHKDRGLTGEPPMMSNHMVKKLRLRNARPHSQENFLLGLTLPNRFGQLPRKRCPPARRLKKSSTKPGIISNAPWIEGCPIAIANMGWHFKSTPFEQQIIFSQH
jgi:hypothetical protein